MTTDNQAVDYRYISRRLTRDIVQQHEAGRRRPLGLVGITLGPFAFRWRTLSPDYHNQYKVALRATDAVSDNTGSLGAPGAYLRATMQMELDKVAVHIGFEDTASQEVAGYFADQDVPVAGRVFVALLGSIHNLVGWRAADRLLTDRCPSDVDGMYEVLAASLEPQDNTIETEFLERERDEPDERWSIEAAHRLAFRDGSRLKNLRSLEFLARVHVCVQDVEVCGDRYQWAVLGAPIWVATPAPAPVPLR